MNAPVGHVERPLRLLILIEVTHCSGLAKGLLDFCQYLRSRHSPAPIQASFVTFCRIGAGTASNQFIDAARAAGFEVEVIDERFRFDPRAVVALRRVIERRAPDIIETEHVKSHFLTRLTGAHRHHRWVAVHHGYTEPDFKMRLFNQLDRWSLRAPDRILTVCQNFAGLLAERGAPEQRIRVTHNSIRPEDARPTAKEARPITRAALRLKSNQRMILSVGRLSKEKAHANLLRAFARLRQMSPELSAHLVIAGSGPERNALLQLAARLELTEHLTLTGQVDDPAPWYAAADLFVLPSNSEGSPYVLLEAMLWALPIVATRIGGIPEIVTSEYDALLVPPNDPQSMAEAMRRVLSEPGIAQQLAKNARHTVINRHSPEQRFQFVATIYDELAQYREEVA